MNLVQILGIGVLATGAILVGFGYHASEAPVDRISNALTGRYTDSTMWFIIGGAVTLVSGGVLAVFGKRVI